MTTETITETIAEPTLEAPPASWPPVAHIIRKKDYPPREGTIALCGAKLMGVDLKNMAADNVCGKCSEIMRKETSQ